MARYYTDFSENTVATGTPSGWTQRIRKDTSQTAQIITSALSGKSFRLNSGNGGSFVFSYNAIDNQQDMETLTLFRIVDTGQGGRFGINYNRYEGTSEATTKGYNISFTQVSSVLSCIIAEDSTGSVGWFNYAWSLNTWYYMRFRTVKNRLSARIWAYGSAEPTTWNLDAESVSPTIATPYAGVGHFVQDSHIEYNYFAAGVDTDKAFMPGETINDHKTGMRNLSWQDFQQEPTNNYTAGRISELTDIVIHWWDEPSNNPTLSGVVSHFKDPDSEVSAHFVVSGDTIVQMVDIANTAWHCSGNNAYTIGIEINPNLPAGTYQSVASLIRFLRAYTGKALPIHGHNEMPGNESTACPGLVSRAFVDELSQLALDDNIVQFRAYDGSDWKYHPVRVWDGSQWINRKPKYWNGSAWVE